MSPDTASELLITLLTRLAPPLPHIHRAAWGVYVWLPRRHGYGAPAIRGRQQGHHLRIVTENRALIVAVKVPKLLGSAGLSLSCDHSAGGS